MECRSRRGIRRTQECTQFGTCIEDAGFQYDIVIDCDASGRGVWAVLSHKDRPIAFYSKALAERALAKSTYKKELIVLVWAIQHRRHYLLVKKFIVLTEHKSLRSLLQQRITTPYQQHWLAKLLGYEFETKFKPGISNGAADVLSQRVDGAELSSISLPVWLDWEEV